MRYVDGFREESAAAALRDRLHATGAELARRGLSPRVMEVCGTHTMAIARHGIRDALPDNVELISGPGCPVCVTPPGYLDAAIRLAREGAVIVTFGDMLHVPGSETTLAVCRAKGGDVRVCYSPSAALQIARETPGREVVFLGIGFETTMAPVLCVAEAALRAGVRNLSLLTAFKLVPPALRALSADPASRPDAYLCPAHVSAIIGADAYLEFSGPGGVPCVIAGFEPLDILLGLAGVLDQLVEGSPRVDNQYSRVVRPGGNPKALALMDRYLAPCDACWRGIGVIPGSGMALRGEMDRMDAARRFGVTVGEGKSHPGCRCGEVLKGKLRPPECPLFGTACAPDHPVGPCMVSSEGTCAAWYRYRRIPRRGEPGRA